jgi:putative transposase
MTEKYQNKYRIASARLQNWDYASEGAYFITICTKDRRHYFGAVKNGKMVLSNAGVIANLMWHEIKNHGKNVELGEFIVMPNHVHGILILNDISNLDPGLEVQTEHALSLAPPAPPAKSPGQQRFQNQGKNTISSIVGSYKSAVTKYCNRLGFEFGWQTRFYDHIIRDGRAFENISSYIINNPEKWDIDKFYAKE